jgi:phosphotransferase system enzyme I (PtsI)
MMSVSHSKLVFKGKVASGGFAHGALVRVREVGRRGVRKRAKQDDEERALRAALAVAAREIEALAEAEGDAAAEILEFQLALLDDQGLLEPIFEAIAAGTAADSAWGQALAEQIADYRLAPDEYQRARAADLMDLRDRVLAALNGGVDALVAVPSGAIVCAEDLPPSRFLAIDWSRGGGVACEQGSPTSHVAMLARARGIPMVVQLGALPDETGTVLLDGEQATLELDPPESRVADFKARSGAHERNLAASRRVLTMPSVAWCNEPVRVLINIQGVADLAHPDARYADGIGLMRTEFLFDGVGGLPDEDTQYSTYESVLRWAGDRPVTIRTVDAGGDKPIRGFTEDGEANPFLGVRGLRLCLKRPEIFSVQLRALGRAAVLGNLKVMFPMVTTPAELIAAGAMFEEVVDALKAAGIAATLPPLGIMVEVPAAALTIDTFPASFFSIGSNDLTQYVTACDRSNGALATLNDPLNPGVLELIRRAAEHGRRSGISVSVCGDMAGDPRCTVPLLDCGVREFSMSPPLLARVKQAIVASSPQEYRG